MRLKPLRLDDYLRSFLMNVINELTHYNDGNDKSFDHFNTFSYERDFSFINLKISDS